MTANTRPPDNSHMTRFVIVVMVLAGMGMGIVAWRLMDVVLLNPTMTAAAGGAFLVLLGVLSAAVFGIVDGWSDAAQAFGAAMGHSRRGSMEVVDSAAKANVAAGQAVQRAAAGGGGMFPPLPVYSNGNGNGMHIDDVEPTEYQGG